MENSTNEYNNTTMMMMPAHTDNQHQYNDDHHDDQTLRQRRRGRWTSSTSQHRHDVYNDVTHSDNIRPTHAQQQKHVWPYRSLQLFQNCFGGGRDERVRPGILAPPRATHWNNANDDNNNNRRDASTAIGKSRRSKRSHDVNECINNSGNNYNRNRDMNNNGDKTYKIPPLPGQVVHDDDNNNNQKQLQQEEEEVPTVVGEETNSSLTSDDHEMLGSEYDFDTSDKAMSFLMFRCSYLFVTLVVMLADGLQGTHLYVLYESYGFSVASLYCLGFITGAFTAPITGPLIDRFGRKKSALLYCALEVGINMLEQFPFLSGLIVSRVVGGVTTNLLSTVFEAWLDTEYRNRGFAQEEYEIIMRDSVVVSNLAAIASGYLAHVLAESLGAVGPFEGAVSCTAIAFVVIAALWTENYGKSGVMTPVDVDRDEQAKSVDGSNDGNSGEEDAGSSSSSESILDSDSTAEAHSFSTGETIESNESKSAFQELKDTINFIRSDSSVLRICITQGLTLGSLHTFIFLWSPLMKEFTAGVVGKEWGLDSHGEPAYGLIFGAYMAAGVLGGLCSPFCRRFVTFLLSPLVKSSVPETVTVDDGETVRPMDVEFQGAICYLFCAILLLVPSLLSASNPYTFSVSLVCFILYEFWVGVYSPCEGVIRSIYIPPESRGTVMTVPSIIVNVAVALAVVSTECIPRQMALAIIAMLLLVCSGLQLSLVSKKEWNSLLGRIEHARRASLRPLQSFSHSIRSVCSAKSSGDDSANFSLGDDDSIGVLTSKEKEE